MKPINYFVVIFLTVFSFCTQIFSLPAAIATPIYVELSASEERLQTKYPIEVEDPYHRHTLILKPALQIWINDWKDKIDNFWSFLEVNQSMLSTEIPKLYDPYYHMVWLDEVERKNYEVTFHKGAYGGVLLSTPQEGILLNGKWMYILLDGKFYAAQEQKYRFHHVSLSAGLPVQCAGGFNIKNGHLATLSLSSGHYRPEVAHGLQCIHQLQNLHLDLSQVIVSYAATVMGEKIKMKVPVEEFLKLEQTTQ